MFSLLLLENANKPNIEHKSAYQPRVQKASVAGASLMPVVLRQIATSSLQPRSRSETSFPDKRKENKGIDEYKIQSWP